MTGLDKIIDKINSDSQKAAEEILCQAEEKKREILKKAEETASLLEEKLLNQTNEKCVQITSRARSSAELARTQNILSAKRRIIDSCIEDAKQELLSYPDGMYFDFMQRLLAKNKCNGEIVLNSRDKQRLPKDFDLMGMTLSEKDGDFEGGFVLIDGNIEINCTVSALFYSAADELSDIVNSILFRGV